MNKHVIVCLVNASSFGGEVFLRVSRQVRYLENSLLDRALLSPLSHLSLRDHKSISVKVPGAAEGGKRMDNDGARQ